MLRALIRMSLDHASLVLACAALTLGLAAWQVPRMAVDVFPELNAPTVVILTEAPGYAAEEVEQFVSFPLESAVNGAPGVRRVRSSSAIGLSLVWVEFDWGVDIYRARQQVSERLALAREGLPERAEPVMTPVTSITGEVMLISLSSERDAAGRPRVSPLELRAYAEFELRNALLAVPGVAQVVAIGGELPEYQVLVEPERLRLEGLTMGDVVAAARGAHSAAGGGYLTNVDGLELPLRQDARVRSTADIARAIVGWRGGAPLTLGQVAEVVEAGALKRGAASEGGEPAVILSIQKAPGTNTLALTAALDEAFDALAVTLPEGARLNRAVMRQSDFIEAALDKVLEVSRDAALIVCVVIALFLLDLRATLITLTAIPISVAVALLALAALGETVNVMTLGGLAVAIGVVVDDGIIDVENVIRRLREDGLRPAAERRPLKELIFEASNEIRGSILFATLIIVMVFAPLLLLQGLEGRFFRPMGAIYVIAVGASLGVAMTLTPALCLLLMRGARFGEEREGWVARGLLRLYEPALGWALRWRKLTLGLAAASCAAALLLASTFGTSFLPEFNEGTLTVFVLAPPGTSLEESDALAGGVERRIAAIPGVRAVARRTGRAERDEHAEPVSNSEFEVSLEAGASKEAVRARIDAALAEVKGLTSSIGQPIEHRLSHVLSGTPAAVAINLFGEDLEVLRELAKEVAAALEALPAARDVNAQREVTVTSLAVDLRRDELARWGLGAAEVAEQVQAAVYGEAVAEVREGARRADIVVRLAERARARPEDVGALLLRGRGGARVRLREVADIHLERSPALISREGLRRKAVVSANVAEGANLGDLVAELEARIRPLVEAASKRSQARGRGGVTVAFGGQFEAQQSASRTLFIAGAAVAVVMLLLLQMSFGSFRAAAVVMLNLPLALIGGIVALFLAESPSIAGNLAALLGLAEGYEAPVISISSLVGFVTLFGIAVRNGILLVNHIIALEAEAAPDAVARGARERLIPILMTALTAVLGLIPLALAAGEPGSELLAPLALVVLGGLVSSTLLNLLVIPAGYSLIARPPEARP